MLINQTMEEADFSEGRYREREEGRN